MQRSLWTLLAFATVMTLVVGGSHYYLWTRLVRATALGGLWRQVLTGVLVTLAALLPVAFVGPRLLDAPWTRGVALVGFSWLGLVFLLLLAVVLGDALHTGLHYSQGPFDEGRRTFLARLFGGGAAALAAVAGSAALREGLRAPERRDVTVTLAKLPRALDGLRVVQISDLHVGPTIRREDVADLVRRTNELQPDLVALTGDFVDGSVEHLRDQVAPFAELKARLGVFFVTGNHEYYSGADAWLAEWRRLGVRTLRNERVQVAEGLDVAGIDDATAHRFGHGHGANLGQALAGRNAEHACILLAHQPRHIDEAAKAGVCLQLSGHTHGGQIWPFSYLVLLQQPFVAGLGQRNNTQIYVSRGTGYWGPPMRLAAPSELTCLTLRSVA